MRSLTSPLRSVAALASFAALLLASCGQQNNAAPSIPFAPAVDSTIKDPDNPTKVFHLDFARVDERYPLSRKHLIALTPENFQTLSQEQVDQVYARLAAGSRPDGVYFSQLFFARDNNLADRLEKIVGGFRGRLVGTTIDTLSVILRAVWRGKMFYRDEGIARTLIEDLATLQPLVDDSDTVMTATVPRRGPLRFIVPNTKAWLLFPAKVYCGQSLLDGRRESIIIDYNYGEDIEGYRASPDRLVGRGGLQLRDEIRMVRPGFYLGRAYVGGMFLLNFTLYNDGLAQQALAEFAAGQPVVEDCWVGEQARNAFLP